jgi:siroheme synthase-like protein
VSFYPLMLDGHAIRALVVGGGAVAVRKIRALLEAGASVRVTAITYSPDVLALAGTAQLKVEPPAAYTAEALGDATLVIAATDDAHVNARIASDARSRGTLVNVVSEPDAGTCVTPAVHRAGGLVIAVSAGGVPGAAARVRSAIAERFDGRYAAAVTRLTALRGDVLGSRDAAARERWTRAQRALIGDDFCDVVERGDFEARVSEWA